MEADGVVAEEQFDGGGSGVLEAGDDDEGDHCRVMLGSEPQDPEAEVRALGDMEVNTRVTLCYRQRCVEE